MRIYYFHELYASYRCRRGDLWKNLELRKSQNSASRVLFSYCEMAPPLPFPPEQYDSTGFLFKCERTKTFVHEKIADTRGVGYFSFV